MKKKILIFLAAFIIYFVAYVVVRWTHPASETEMVADAQGEYHPKRFEATGFLARKSGFSRVSSPILFVVFYPMGQLDHLITGRRYVLGDEWDAPAMNK